jgi:hypothetical protein
MDMMSKYSENSKLYDSCHHTTPQKEKENSS